VKKSVITIGGGIAGIETSNILSEMGYEVTLLEKDNSLGGKLLRWDRLFPTFRHADEVLSHLEEQKKQHPFQAITNAEVASVTRNGEGFTVQTTQHRYFTADAVVLASGFDLFNARRKEEYGYRIYDNVITSVDLERMMKEDGTVTTVVGAKTPGRIAFVHCVGSRDEKVGNHHCSKVCCVTGVKQAIEIQQMYPRTEIFCFYMDLRMYGEGFEELYRSAQEKNNIQFIRGRVSEVSENIDSSLQLKAEDTLSGRPLKMNVDLLILLVGMEPSAGTSKIQKQLELETQPSGFLKPLDTHFARNVSSQEGIFMAGTCICPMSVNDVLENARSAASEVHRYLGKSQLVISNK
jgi:heterodisulfide reductase subunit A2